MFSLYKSTFIILLSFALLTISYCQERSQRVKRKLVFNKTMRFFIRLNGKDNIVKWNTIVTHGWGFRVNFELPDSFHRRHKFFKRDIHTEIDNVPTTWGQKGFSCLLKYLCEITARVRSADQCGVFCEIGNIIAQSTGTDASFFKSLTSRCDRYQEKCPFPFEYMKPTSDR